MIDRERERLINKSINRQADRGRGQTDKQTSKVENVNNKLKFLK